MQVGINDEKSEKGVTLTRRSKRVSLVEEQENLL